MRGKSERREKREEEKREKIEFRQKKCVPLQLLSITADKGLDD